MKTNAPYTDSDTVNQFAQTIGISLNDLFDLENQDLISVIDKSVDIDVGQGKTLMEIFSKTC